MRPTILKADNLTKRFRHITALDRVTLTVEEGTITAVVGDNGSGKSTFIKIIAGMLKPDEGTVTIGGISCQSLTPHKALELGVRTVYQDLALDNCKDSIENIFLGAELMRGPFLDRCKMAEKASDVLAGLNITIPDLYEPVRNLSGGQRQGVALARALLNPGRLLLLDEPTAAMGIGESHRTYELFRRFRAEGMTQLLVSHNLQQVYDLADEIYVFRSGRCLMHTATADVPLKDLQDLLIHKEEDLL